MKQPNPSRDARQPALSRRNMVAGVGIAGATAAAAAVLPVVSEQAKTLPKQESKPDAGAGYRLTEHVQRYYRTAKV